VTKMSASRYRRQQDALRICEEILDITLAIEREPRSWQKAKMEGWVDNLKSRLSDIYREDTEQRTNAHQRSRKR